MSMIVATFENGELMPSLADGFFRYHDGERTEVAEDGNVEGPVGHFTLRHVAYRDIMDYVREHGDPWASTRKNLTAGWYVDVRGEDGSVWAFHYIWEYQARKDFAEAQRVHGQWCADIDDE